MGSCTMTKPRGEPIMSEAIQAWKDTLARLRFERGQYAKRAAQRRKDAQECRRRRDWVGALVAEDRASEYRRTRDQLTAEISKVIPHTRPVKIQSSGPR